MSRTALEEAVRALGMAWPGTRILSVPGRNLILLPGMRVSGEWSPSLVDGLLIADGWPDQRPQLLIDSALVRNGRAPQGFSVQYVADRSWYSFSFNAPWDAASPHLVPAVRAWLRRFDGRA